jgi:hypothetical protein
LESLRVSPDGRFLAFVSIHDSSTVIVTLDEASELNVIPWGQTTNAPVFVWSPEGTALCVGYIDPSRGESVLEVMDIESGERRVILSDPTGYLIPVDWAMVELGN